jgi:hypothetical protein
MQSIVNEYDSLFYHFLHATIIRKNTFPVWNIQLSFIALYLKVLFMDKETESLETLSEIRSMMERSTRFISLNGLSGVFAGLFALIGAAGAFIYLKLNISCFGYYNYAFLEDGNANTSFYVFILLDAFLVLFASLIIAILLSMRKAKKKGLRIWDSSTKRLLVNMFIPLCIGGIFCIILIYHKLLGFVAPATLIFYGLALINASKYTLNDIRHLGFAEAGLGLFASIWIGYGLLFWAVGFGVLHILYGIVMYYKYER